MKSVLVGLYILAAEMVYIFALFCVAYFFVKFFWNKEKIQGPKGKIKVVEKEKPNKKRVLEIFGFLCVVILVLDIVCAYLNIDIIAAYRAYPFNMEKSNYEGIYPRFLYNMQLTGDTENRDVKFNILFLYDVHELEKTKVRSELKKNKTTYFEDKKNEIEMSNSIENRIENTLENVIENTLENKVDNKVGNKILNETVNKVNTVKK